MNNHPSQTLASFAADVCVRQIPDPVLRRAEDLMLDWFGSALAGKVGAPGAEHPALRRADGPGRGPERNADLARHQLAALRGAW